MVLSSDAETRFSPSAEKATERTVALWDRMTVDSPRTVGSHRRMDLSREPEAMRFPDGAAATENTGPCSRRRPFESRAKPEGPAACMRSAHRVPRKTKGAHLRLEVPYQDSTIDGPRNELRHVGVEAHGRHRIAVASERPLQRWVANVNVRHGSLSKKKPRIRPGPRPCGGALCVRSFGSGTRLILPHARSRRATTWQLIARFSPTASTFSCVLALTFTLVREHWRSSAIFSAISCLWS